jgi:hypothetical protein
VAMMRTDAAVFDLDWLPDNRAVVVGGAAGLYLFDVTPPARPT